MRTLAVLATILAVMGLAFWAYRENYRTQAAMDDMRAVQDEIAGLRERLGVLNAEWAYLNRPERLARLADLNFDRLGLMPLTPAQLVAADRVAYGVPRAPEPALGGVPGFRHPGGPAPNPRRAAAGAAPATDDTTTADARTP